MITISKSTGGANFILENGDGTQHKFRTDNIQGLAEKINNDYSEEAAGIAGGCLDDIGFIDISEEEENEIILAVKNIFQIDIYNEYTRATEDFLD